MGPRSQIQVRQSRYKVCLRWVGLTLEKAAKHSLIRARYCYGAPYVCDELSQSGICAAGAFAHPAFLKESHFFNLTSKWPLPHRRCMNTDQDLQSRCSCLVRRLITPSRTSSATGLWTSCRRRKNISRSSCSRELNMALLFVVMSTTLTNVRLVPTSARMWTLIRNRLYKGAKLERHCRVV